MEGPVEIPPPSGNFASLCCAIDQLADCGAVGPGAARPSPDSAAANQSSNTEQSMGDEAQPAKARKAYTITKQRERWTDEEHSRFLQALKRYGRAWRRIEEHIGTKTAVQIRSHAQKFFSKLQREQASGGTGKETFTIPPPRPKRRPSHPYPRNSTGSQQDNSAQTSALLPASAWQPQMQQPQTVPIQLPSIPLLSIGGKGGSLDKDQLAAVMAAAQAAAAQAAAAVIAAAGVNVQTQLQAHLPPNFSFWGGLGATGPRGTPASAPALPSLSPFAQGMRLPPRQAVSGLSVPQRMPVRTTALRPGLSTASEPGLGMAPSQSLRRESISFQYAVAAEEERADVAARRRDTGATSAAFTPLLRPKSDLARTHTAPGRMSVSNPRLFEGPPPMLNQGIKSQTSMLAEQYKKQGMQTIALPALASILKGSESGSMLEALGHRSSSGDGSGGDGSGSGSDKDNPHSRKGSNSGSGGSNSPAFSDKSEKEDDTGDKGSDEGSNICPSGRVGSTAPDLGVEATPPNACGDTAPAPKTVPGTGYAGISAAQIANATAQLQSSGLSYYMPQANEGGGRAEAQAGQVGAMASSEWGQHSAIDLLRSMMNGGFRSPVVRAMPLQPDAMNASGASAETQVQTLHMGGRASSLPAIIPLSRSGSAPSGRGDDSGAANKETSGFQPYSKKRHGLPLSSLPPSKRLCTTIGADLPAAGSQGRSQAFSSTGQADARIVNQ